MQHTKTCNMNCVPQLLRLWNFAQKPQKPTRLYRTVFLSTPLLVCCKFSSNTSNSFPSFNQLSPTKCWETCNYYAVWAKSFHFDKYVLLNHMRFFLLLFPDLRLSYIVKFSTLKLMLKCLPIYSIVYFMNGVPLYRVHLVSMRNKNVQQLIKCKRDVGYLTSWSALGMGVPNQEGNIIVNFLLCIVNVQMSVTYSTYCVMKSSWSSIHIPIQITAPPFK